MYKFLLVLGFLLTIGLGFSEAQPNRVCNRILVNDVNSGQAIAADNTAGGLTVLNANSGRCWFFLYNAAGSGSVNCAPTSYTASTTVGVPLDAGVGLGFDEGAQQAWKCIRSGANNGSITAVEGVP